MQTCFHFQIGNHYLVDPTPEEECCSSSGIVVAVSGNKKITAVRKIGSGSLHPDSLVSMLKVINLLSFTMTIKYNVSCLIDGKRRRREGQQNFDDQTLRRKNFREIPESWVHAMNVLTRKKIYD
jgi:hypothetical protein